MQKQFLASLIIFLFIQVAAVHAQKWKATEETDEETEIVDIPAFNQESTYISIGYGFGSYFRTFNFDSQITTIGPLYAKIEKPITDQFGIGINMAFSKNTVRENYSYTTDNGFVSVEEITDINILSILARLTWHYGNFKTFDPYMGFGMGYRLVQSNNIQNSPFNNSDSDDFRNNIPFGFDFTLGARYFFSPQVGVYTEFGIAQSVGQFGICAKF